MKSILVCMTAMVAGACLASPQAGKDAAPTSGTVQKAAGAGDPNIQFQSVEFNFGDVSAGELVKHEFIFTNTGLATLKILDVKPGCGCTSSGPWDREVAPGKTGVIPLQYNSTGFGGRVSKTTTVTCNDPDSAKLILTLKGVVRKPLEVTPNMAMFNLASEGQTNETKVLRIVNNLDEPVTLSDVQCTNQSFRAELKTIRPGLEYELHVTSVPPFEAPTTTATVTIKTSLAKMPVLNVMAYALVKQPLVVQPAKFSLPAGPLKAAVTPSVTIQNNSTNALTLSEPAANVPGVEVRVQEVQPGRYFRLIATFPEGFEVAASQNIEVTVKSNHPKFPLIQVPVFQGAAVSIQRPVSSAVVPQTGTSSGGALPPRAVTASRRIQVPVAVPRAPSKP